MDKETLIKMWEERVTRFDAKARSCRDESDDKLNAEAKAAELRECLSEIRQLD